MEVLSGASGSRMGGKAVGRQTKKFRRIIRSRSVLRAQDISGWFWLWDGSEVLGYSVHRPVAVEKLQAWVTCLRATFGRGCFAVIISAN